MQVERPQGNHHWRQQGVRPETASRKHDAARSTDSFPRRIGLGVAEAFLSSGASVSIIASTQASLDAAATLLASEYPGTTVDGRIADVRDEEAITAAVRALAPVDHIVYTAVDKRIRGDIKDLDIDDAKFLFGVKFWGQVAVAKGESWKRFCLFGNAEEC